MKKISFFLALTAIALNACLPYDNPGDELAQTTVQTDENVYVGNADSIDYTSIYPEAAMKKIVDETLTNQLAQCRGAIMRLRGSNDNVAPTSHGYQYQYNFGPDGYAGYFVVPHSDFMYGPTGNFTSSYCNTPGYASGATSVYGGKNSFVSVLNHPSIDTIPEVKAAILLYFSLSAQEFADLQGPFPFRDHKLNKQSGSFTYDDLETIYTDIVNSLNTIVACFKHAESQPDYHQKIVKDELVKFIQNTCYDFKNSNDPFNYYIRLANAIKLRMAIRIAKVKPALAQQWAEEAARDGLYTAKEQQAAIYNTGFPHPLCTIQESWNDLRICASLETVLFSLDHPYTKNGYLFRKNEGVINNDKETIEVGQVITGLRAGTFFGSLGQSTAGNRYLAASKIQNVGDDMVSGIRNDCPLFFVKWSEVEFCLAEACLRGWNVGGTAQEHYEKGIDYGYFNNPQDPPTTKWTDYVEQYKQLEQPIPYVHKDYFDNNEDWESLTKIGVKWNEADDNETKLEKIITQKWIALFPDSHQAWAELRRTGYPKIFPVLNPDDGDFSLSDGDMIRRIPWNATDPQTQMDIEFTGLPALGGSDEQSTRLWWDVGGAGNNF